MADDDRPGGGESAKSSGKLKAKLNELRKRSPLLDHAMRMVEHYGDVNGSVLAGGVTYFGFVSFFPIVAIGFFVVGLLSQSFPDAQESLTTAIEQIFPGIVSSDGAAGTISLQEIESATAAAGIIGLVGLAYSGLGWLSGLRLALQAVFGIPMQRKRNFVVGKIVDLMVLAVIGIVLIVSVGISGIVKGFAGDILEWVSLQDTWIGPALLWAIGIALGLAASTLLFFVVYRVLAPPLLPARALWEGALLGATGFEVLQLIVIYIFGAVGGSALATLAIAITLIIWINYFSRLVIYGACWSVTMKLTAYERETVVAEAAALVAASRADEVIYDDEPKPKPQPLGRFDAGSAVMGAVVGGVVAVIASNRRKGRDE